MKVSSLYKNGTRKIWKLKKVPKMQTKKLNIFENREVKDEWLTTKEVTKTFGIGESTLYNWRDKGILKIWKKSSTSQVTVYSKSELDKLFSPVEKLKPHKNRKKTELMLTKQKERLSKTKKSDEELVAEYFQKKELNKRKKTFLKEIGDLGNFTKQNTRPKGIKISSLKRGKMQQNTDNRTVIKGYNNESKGHRKLKSCLGGKGNKDI